MPQRNWVHMLMQEYELKTLEETAHQALRLARELADDEEIARAVLILEEIENERQCRRVDDEAPF